MGAVNASFRCKNNRGAQSLQPRKIFDNVEEGIMTGQVQNPAPYL